MDLFKIVGSIVLDNQAAKKGLHDTSKAAKDTSKDLEGASDTGEKSGGKLSGALSKVGSAAAKTAKVTAAGLAAASGVIIAVGKQAISAYADYEQLVGGVETLFKGSAKAVIENASNAYKTAGLSANAYMETVTSFSASLLQSLGGDTVAAAQKADVAIIDMSDNANKMGTSMESIQNAYQGFAKYVLAA